MPHTNAFVGKTVENANQQDLRSGLNTDPGEHSLRMDTDDGRLRTDENRDSGNDSVSTDETRTTDANEGRETNMRVWETNAGNADEINDPCHPDSPQTKGGRKSTGQQNS
ncbi:unnamed protein product [Schistocephalus solidus]|uniref:Uncharacterized protein n=1 Tax=Schistocephalus solidus TaxID=70667 RepID=A0A183T646_SCHSO|nr:unnamed protein product [Schistocephalus solidus]